ncbi:trypco2 family protein [Amycolatopsis sp. NPDC004368]
MDEIGLAEAIEHLRDQLGLAQDAGQNHQFRFEVLEVEVELLVEARREKTGKVDFKVVGGDAKGSSASSHKVKLKLNVKDAALGGQRAEVASGKSFGME